MKRLIIAFIIILIVAGLCTSEFMINARESEIASESLREVQKMTKDGKIDEAIKTMGELKKRWEENIESMLIFISHQRPDEINENIAVAESYLINGEFPEFYAECKRVENELKHFRDLEIPTFSNIL